jgi:hypothetical protein
MKTLFFTSAFLAANAFSAQSRAMPVQQQDTALETVELDSNLELVFASVGYNNVIKQALAANPKTTIEFGKIYLDNSSSLEPKILAPLTCHYDVNLSRECGAIVASIVHNPGRSPQVKSVSYENTWPGEVTGKEIELTSVALKAIFLSNEYADALKAAYDARLETAEYTWLCISKIEITPSSLGSQKVYFRVSEKWMSNIDNRSSRLHGSIVSELEQPMDVALPTVLSSEFIPMPEFNKKVPVAPSKLAN